MLLISFRRLVYQMRQIDPIKSLGSLTRIHRQTKNAQNQGWNEGGDPCQRIKQQIKKKDRYSKTPIIEIGIDPHHRFGDVFGYKNDNDSR